MRLGLIIFLSFSFVLGLHSGEIESLKTQLRETQEQEEKEEEAFAKANIDLQEYHKKYNAIYFNNHSLSKSKDLLRFNEKPENIEIFERYNTTQQALKTTRSKKQKLEDAIKQLTTGKASAIILAPTLLAQSAEPQRLPALKNRPQQQQLASPISSLFSLPWGKALAIGTFILIAYIITQKNKAPVST